MIDWVALSKKQVTPPFKPNVESDESTANFDPEFTTADLNGAGLTGVIPLDDNEGAFSIAVVPFTARGGELMLVVGTAKDTFLAPRSCTTGYLRTYKIINDGQDLELLHKVSG